jgi:integrase
MSEQILKGEAYRNFINSLDSEVTKSHYRQVFPYFMKFCNIDDYEKMLKFDRPKLEGLIRDYLIHLRQDKKLAPISIASYLSAIHHFYEMNDIDLRWNKLKKFKAKLKTVVEDKPYTDGQIKALLAAASLRDKCIILIMASAGLRRGALPNPMKDLKQ